MSFRTIAIFIAAAFIIVILGGLAGWYVFLQRQIAASGTAVHGLGLTPSFGGSSGGFPVSATSSDMLISSSTAPLEKPAPRLWHVGASPVAGYGFASSSVQLYFVDTATGNVSRANPQTSVVERLTNTLMPKIYEALIAPDGSTVLRYDADDSAKTFAGTLATSSEQTEGSPMTLRGLYLPNNIVSIAMLSPRTLVYVIENPAGGSVVVQSDWKGGALKKLFASPLSNWTLEALSDGSVALIQKPSDGVAGTAFALSGGAITALTDPLPGLTVRSRVGGARLFGTSDGSVQLFVQSSPTAKPVLLSIRTSADKCVWASGVTLTAYCAVPRVAGGATYLRDRYQGALHTSDTWYKVNASSATVEELFVPEVPLDVMNPQIDARGTYIAFTNAVDRSLWMLRIAP